MDRVGGVEREGPGAGRRRAWPRASGPTIPALPIPVTITPPWHRRTRSAALAIDGSSRSRTRSRVSASIRSTSRANASPSASAPFVRGESVIMAIVCLPAPRRAKAGRPRAARSFGLPDPTGRNSASGDHSPSTVPRQRDPENLAQPPKVLSENIHRSEKMIYLRGIGRWANWECQEDRPDTKQPYPRLPPGSRRPGKPAFQSCNLFRVRPVTRGWSLNRVVGISRRL